MRLFRRTKAQPTHLNRPEALACVVQIMPGVSWRVLESGEVLIEYPLMLKPLLRAVFNRFSDKPAERLTRKLQLDRLGSQVWLFVDGRRNVGEIINAFAAATTMTRQEAETSVTAFLRELGRRGLIVLH